METAPWEQDLDITFLSSCILPLGNVPNLVVQKALVRSLLSDSVPSLSSTERQHARLSTRREYANHSRPMCNRRSPAPREKLPKSKLYLIWLVFGIYLYFSMWLGTLLGNAEPQLSDVKHQLHNMEDYMLMPLVFVAAGLVIEDRKAIKTIVMIAAASVLLVDRGSLRDSMSRSWEHFDENKRDGGPLSFAGSNGLAAFLSNATIFFWDLPSI